MSFNVPIPPTNLAITEAFVGGPTETAAFGSNTTAGNAIVVVVANQGSAGVTFTQITDSQGNAYVPCMDASTSSATVGNGTQMATFVSFGIAGGANTLTAHWTGTSDAIAIYGFEVAGIGAFDVGSGGSGTSATASTSSMTTTRDLEIVISATINTGSGLSAGAGFVLIELTQSFEDVLQYARPTAGPITATSILSGSQSWGIVAAAFCSMATMPVDAIFYGMT